MSWDGHAYVEKVAQGQRLGVYISTRNTNLIHGLSVFSGTTSNRLTPSTKPPQTARSQQGTQGCGPGNGDYPHHDTLTELGFRPTMLEHLNSRANTVTSHV